MSPKPAKEQDRKRNKYKQNVALALGRQLGSPTNACNCKKNSLMVPCFVKAWKQSLQKTSPLSLRVSKKGKDPKNMNMLNDFAGLFYPTRIERTLHILTEWNN